MTMNEIVSAIEAKHRQEGITVKAPALVTEVEFFEEQVGFKLPDDFRAFYFICNGFECTADIFNMLSLNDILGYQGNYGEGWFDFAEYMIFSDLWSLRRGENNTCEIYNRTYGPVVLTQSLKTFLSTFLQGNVFGKGSLYDWQEKIRKG